MKATRKLIPALAMLLIAATVATSASYAWFTMNASVTATGMQITATTSGSLLISKANTDWTAAGTNLNLSADFTTPIVINPVSMTPAAAAGTWYTAVGTNANDGTASGAASTTYTAHTFTDPATATSVTLDSKIYALHERFYVQSPTGALNNFGLQKVVFTAKGTGHSDIESAVCVRVELKPVDGASDTIKYVTWANSGSTEITYVNGAASTATATGYVLTGNNTDLKKNATDSIEHTLDAIAVATSYQIDVYIYLDGANTKCTAYNAFDWAGCTVDLTFGADISYGNVNA